MNYSGYSSCDMANGDGCRVSLFVSGCTLACKGCFNRSAWNFKNGEAYTPEFEEKLLQDVSEPFIDGLSILGGDPMERSNAPVVLELCKKVKEQMPHKTIWLWTGRTQGEILDGENKAAIDILNYIDVLIDGRYEEELKDDLKWRGSSNQRVIKLTNI